MFAPRKLDPRREMAFIVGWAGFVGVFWIVSLMFLVGDFAGGDTTATVVHVSSQEAYTIRFTTEDGTGCELTQKWTPRAVPVKVGDTFEVHYSSPSPCENAKRADDWFARFGFEVIPILLAVVGWIRIRELRQQMKSSARA